MTHEELLNRLLQSQVFIRKNTLATASRKQGAYILWVDETPRVCLKIGIAGTRQGEGLKGRLKRHFSCSSVLGRHLMADKTSLWLKGYDPSNKEQCKKFLAEKCCFQTLDLPELTRNELESFEDFIEAKLKPRYAGRVRE